MFIIVGDKIMNKEGFTLVEILMSVAIIGLIAVITVPSITFVNKKIKQRDEIATKKLILDAAKIYGKDKKTTIFNNYNNEEYEIICKIISVQDVVDAGYFEEASLDQIEAETTKIILILRNNNTVSAKYYENAEQCSGGLLELET